MEEVTFVATVVGLVKDAADFVTNTINEINTDITLYIQSKGSLGPQDEDIKQWLLLQQNIKNFRTAVGGIELTFFSDMTNGLKNVNTPLSNFTNLLNTNRKAIAQNLAGAIKFTFNPVPTIAQLNNLKTTFGASTKLMEGYWNGAWTAMLKNPALNSIDKVTGGALAKLPQTIATALAPVTKTLSGFFTSAGQLFTLWINSVTLGWSTFWNNAEKITTLLTTNIGNIIRTTFIAAQNYIMVPLQTAFTWITTSFTALWTSITDIGSKIVNGIKIMVDGITSALSLIKFPHVSIGWGHSEFLGHKVDYPTFNVDWYENGGFIPYTGLAMVHQGEFVLSRGMLEGRQQMPGGISRVLNNNQPITINATIGSNMDLNSLGYRLAFLLRNSR